MTEQVQNQESQEQSIEQKIEDLQAGYVKFAVQQTFGASGGNPECFDEVWDLVKNGVQLNGDHSVIINGRKASEFFKAFGASKDLKERFFQAELPTHPAPEQSAQKPRNQAEPQVLYVSEMQLKDRAFMRQAGQGILQAIREDRVQIDPAKAVKSGLEIREFLAPKEVEGKATKQSPRTKEISKSDLMNRALLLRLDREWANEGGFTGAIQKGLVKVV
ncbi:hypothetical protein H6F89_00025 [Cyanobacteria bacterium FACHB-63]|nr:hypothetical protein [Cyanobacteria bacterium FACHB-63]